MPFFAEAGAATDVARLYAADVPTALLEALHEQLQKVLLLLSVV